MQVQSLANGTPALNVRGPLVVAHARRLARVHAQRFGADSVRIDEQVCLALGRLVGVPDAILDYAIIPETDAEADDLVQRFRERRTGYTRASYETEGGASGAAGDLCFRAR